MASSSEDQALADLKSERYVAYHHAVLENDVRAKYDLIELDEDIAQLERERLEAQEAWDRYERAKRHEGRRVPVQRPIVRRGRSRRPACNQRRRGSRRTASARAGPNDPDDPEPPGLAPHYRRQTEGAAA